MKINFTTSSDKVEMNPYENILEPQILFYACRLGVGYKHKNVIKPLGKVSYINPGTGLLVPDVECYLVKLSTLRIKFWSWKTLPWCKWSTTLKQPVSDFKEGETNEI